MNPQHCFLKTNIHTPSWLASKWAKQLVCNFALREISFFTFFAIPCVRARRAAEANHGPAAQDRDVHGFERNIYGSATLFSEDIPSGLASKWSNQLV